MVRLAMRQLKSLACLSLSLTRQRQSMRSASTKQSRSFSGHTQIVPGQLRRFDIGLGAITIQTLRVADKHLTFHYTPEVDAKREKGARTQLVRILVCEVDL
jgi:hypothetical protein